MTLSAEAAAPGVDRDVVAQQFTEIYAANQSRVIRYAGVFLDKGQTALAEDMAQEAFIQLWKNLVKGSTVDVPTVYGLLKLYARRAIHDYYKASRNNERSFDLGDPVNSPLMGTRHTYALGAPGLSPVVQELDRAMADMSQASELWRSLNKESARLRLLLADNYRDHLGGLSVASRQKLEDQAQETEHREDQALAAFRETCRRVGELRAEVESVAGPNWRSCTGMPASQATGGPLSYAKDPTATHCTKGHLMDRLNTAFTAAGERRCRACAHEKHVKAKPRNTESRSRTVAPEVIEQARELLAAPDKGHSIRSVATLLGVGQMSLYRAFPGGVTAVRRAAELAGAGTR